MTIQSDASVLALVGVWLNFGLTLLVDNVQQVVGAATGIAGALMLAMKYKHAAWTWPIWFASNVAWGWYGASTGGYGLVLQQIVFGTINLYGTWVWLVKPLLTKPESQFIPPLKIAQPSFRK